MVLASGLFPSGFPTKTPYTPLISHVRATCRAHRILDFINRTILGEEYRSLSSSLCSLLHSPVTSPFLGPNIPLSTLFSNTLSLRSTHNLGDQVSHPYKTTGGITVLYILIFKFFWNQTGIQKILRIISMCRWSSGQSFWLQIQRSRVRSPALPDFFSSSGSGTGSTQPREVNWGATWMKKVAAPGLENRD